MSPDTAGVARGSAPLCEFRLDGKSLGFDVRDVQEVLRGESMTRVPLADPVIGGLINLRGTIVTAIDLRRRLDLDEAPARRASSGAPGSDERRPLNVILRNGDGLVSVEVDACGEVVEPSPEALEPAPARLAPALAGLVTAVCKLEGRLMLVLDPKRLLAPRAAPRASIAPTAPAVKES